MGLFINCQPSMPMKFIASVALLLVLFSFASCGSSRMYYSEAQVYVKALNQEMVRAGLPASGRILFEAGGWKIGPFKGGGVSLNAYGVKDTELANRLIKRTREIHTQFRRVPVTVTVYSNMHIDTLHPGEKVILARTEIH